jgi:hypothetical protein
MKDRKYNRVVSPKGLASYPFINKPSTKFNPDGEYSIKLIVGKDEARGFANEIKKVIADYETEQKALLKKDKLKHADLPYSVEGDNVVFRFKSPAVIKARSGDTWDQKVAIFDAKGNPCTELVGSNSVVKVACEISPYYVPAIGLGASLRLKAVQVLELVAPSMLASASAFGFSAEEEGFVSGGESFPEEVFSESEETVAADSNVTSGEEF